MEESEPDWGKIYYKFHMRFRRNAYSGLDVDSALQDGLLGAWLIYSSGKLKKPNEIYALTNRIVQRRLADQRRYYSRRTKFLSDKDVDVVREEEPVDEKDDSYYDMLRENGASENWVKFAELFSNGIRTNRGIARLLQKDQKTIKESRQRFLLWLEKIAISWN